MREFTVPYRHGRTHKMLTDTYLWCRENLGKRVFIRCQDGERTWSTMEKFAEVIEDMDRFPTRGVFEVMVEPQVGGGFTACMTKKGVEPIDDVRTVSRIQHEDDSVGECHFGPGFKLVESEGKTQHFAISTMPNVAHFTRK